MGWRIGEILVQKKLLTWEQLELALEDQKQSKKLLGEVLVDKGFVPKLCLYQALAEQHKIRFVDLQKTKINPKAVELIPLEFAIKHDVIPIEIRTGCLYLGICNVLNLWPETEVKQLTGLAQIQTVLCLPEHIRDAIKRAYYKLEPEPSQAS